MSDPIARILVGHCFMPPDHDDDPADMELAMAERVAKQIRQQIGREMLKHNPEWLRADCIREVCQMDKPTLIDNEPLARYAREKEAQSE